MQNRQLTFRYLFFYVLFSPAAWQILLGIMAAWLLYPLVVSPDTGNAGRAMLFIMLATIGFTATGVPGRWITGMLKKWILGGNFPGK